MTTATTSKTIGFGINNDLLGGHVGIFVNVVIDGITETLILNDDGSFDLEILKAILSHEDSTLYKSGETSKPKESKEELLAKLMSK